MIGTLTDVQPKLTRSEKRAATDAKRLKEAKHDISIVVNAGLELGTIDSLIALLEQPGITKSKYRKVIKSFKRSYPDVAEGIARSVELMDRIPPCPSTSLALEGLLHETVEDKPSDKLVGYYD